MLYTVTLEQLVPADNFYRRLNKVLNLHWLYAATKDYYGQEGLESIDPVTVILTGTLIQKTKIQLRF